MGKKLKICVLASLIPPDHVGGTEIGAQTFSEYFSKSHEVYLVAKHDPGKKEKDKINGVNIVRVKAPMSFPFLRFFFYLRGFVKALEEIKPDVIYVRDLSLPAYAAAFYNKSSGTPFFVQLEGSDILWPNRLMKHTLNKMVARRVFRFLSATKEMTEIVKKEYGRDDTVLTKNPVDTKSFRDAKPIRLNMQGPVIMFIGRLDENKGCRIILESFQSVSKEVPEANLVIIGEGPLKGEFEERYEQDKRIHFFGKQPHEKIKNFLKSADVFVLPSINEAQGVILGEAVSAGKPIVASKLPGIAEYLGDKNGLLATPGDPHDLARKIVSLMRNKNLMKKMSSENFKKSLSIDFQQVGREYIKLFREAIKWSTRKKIKRI
ncbi:MAG: glycosyltransferase family 4 protein [Nanoarchaeota archaeon]|nr:glycosyltransferase family 4 protein [Nanoarchaeota archaeon]MBU0977072.1 glycosyltransferase family 4 protein [Nanoarchaeota archaeon]